MNSEEIESYFLNEIESSKLGDELSDLKNPNVGNSLLFYKTPAGYRIINLILRSVFLEKPLSKDTISAVNNEKIKTVLKHIKNLDGVKSTTCTNISRDNPLYRGMSLNRKQLESFKFYDTGYSSTSENIEHSYNFAQSKFKQSRNEEEDDDDVITPVIFKIVYKESDVKCYNYIVGTSHSYTSEDSEREILFERNIRFKRVVNFETGEMSPITMFKNIPVIECYIEKDDSITDALFSESFKNTIALLKSKREYETEKSKKVMEYLEGEKSDEEVAKEMFDLKDTIDPSEDQELALEIAGYKEGFNNKSIILNIYYKMLKE